MISLAAAYRYPVKSLGGEPLTSVELAPGRGIAADRAYALVPAGADARAPGWRPKRRCVALVRNAPLARLAARVDPVSGALVIANGAGEVARGRPENGDERARIEAALNGVLAAEVGAVSLAAAGPDAMLSDVDAPYVSLVNLASVEALGAAMGTKVDPLRFRANFYLRAPPAWCERGWIGRKAALGGATLEIVDVIVRCAATEVNPATAERDLAILAGLAGFGHAEMGVYAKVLAPGRIGRGAVLGFVD